MEGKAASDDGSPQQRRMSDHYCDIFISYAHLNNVPLPGVRWGWVTTFVETLKNYLGQELGRRDAFKLWMDYEKLRGNNAVTPAIHRVLAEARTLVLFLSEGYMTSPWCREELANFSERFGAESGRIFAVEVSPLRSTKDPLPDLRKYRFWVEDVEGKPRTLGDPWPDPTQPAYYTELQDLARDLAATLTPRQDWNRDDFTVLVHGGQDDLALARDTAARLGEQGVSCTLPISALTPFDAARASAAEVSKDLRDHLGRSSALLLVYDRGPIAQVRRLVNEFRKRRAEDAREPGRIAVCQRHEDRLALGMAAPDLEIFVTPEPCSDSCARQFVEAFIP